MSQLLLKFKQMMIGWYLAWVARQFKSQLKHFEDSKVQEGKWDRSFDLAVEILDMIPDVLIRSVGKREMAKYMLFPSFLSAYIMIDWLKSINYFVSVRSVNKMDRYIPNELKAMSANMVSIRFSMFVKDSSKPPYDVYEFYRDLQQELSILANGLEELRRVDGDLEFYRYYLKTLSPFYPSVFSVVETLAEMSLEHA